MRIQILASEGDSSSRSLAIYLSVLPTALLSSPFNKVSAKNTQTVYWAACRGLAVASHRAILPTLETETSSRSWGKHDEVDSQVGSTPDTTSAGVFCRLRDAVCCLLGQTQSIPSLPLSQ